MDTREHGFIIIGIHAGRRDGTCETALEQLLSATGREYRIYRLNEYRLESCDACLGCMAGRGCVKADSFERLSGEISRSDAMVFAAPEYWQGVNGKARLFWERLCFSGRHLARFPYAGLPVILIGVAGDGNAEHARADLLRFAEDARMETVLSLGLQGAYACFVCGSGEECPVSGLREIFPAGVSIDASKVPCLENQGPHLPEEMRPDPAPEKLRRAARQLLLATDGR
jgi:multimeric flavodoxin WrbA